MTDDGSQLNNKELVGRALDTVQTELQSMIIAQMKLQYGLGWWSKIITDRHVRLPIDALSYSEIDDETARGFMDILICYGLIKNYDILEKRQLRKYNKLLYDTKEVRNSKSHTGKATYSVEEARKKIDTLITLDDALDLNVRDTLLYFRDQVREGDVLPAKKLKATGCPVPDLSNESTVTIATSSPAGSLFDLREVCMTSCDGIFEALDASAKGKNTTDASYVVKNGRYVLTLKNNMQIDSETGIRIDGQEFSGSSVTFGDYDKNTRQVMMFPGPIVKEALHEGSKIELFTDMKWLVQRTKSFFEDYGDDIGFPPAPSLYSPSSWLSSRFKLMTPDQKSAVNMILTQPLSYVWGIPGSGKTQYVLSSAINECVIRGERVAVIAPTNQSLEQVLYGLIDSLGEHENIDINRDIVRIGNPTSEFVRKFPSMCEDKKVSNDLNDRISARDFYKDVLMERRYEELKASIDEAIVFAKKTDESSSQILYGMMSPLLEAMKKDRRFKINVARVNSRTIYRYAEPIRNMIYGRDRSKFLEGELSELSDKALNENISDLDAEIERIVKSNPKAKINDCKVVAMTLSKFLVSFGPEARSGRRKLDVKHVFVDEAGYCNAIQLLSLFSLGVPITLLGDHMQLPPVCEVDDKDLTEWVKNANPEHRFDFFWSLSSLYVDGFFAESTDQLAELYLNDASPDFKYTSVARLTTTHRFGQNLADSLGRCIYGMDLKSNKGDDLIIEIIDAHIDEPETDCEGKIVRVNPAETAAIVSYFKKSRPVNCMVLTPYKSQASDLRPALKLLRMYNVLNIHKSQGREWDTVILSVCDGRWNDETKPLRFSSTTEGMIGMQVMNTAISRAKKKLVIVCDTEFWLSREGELIGDLIRTCGTRNPGTGSQLNRG